MPSQDVLCLHTHRRLIWGEKQKVTIQSRSLLIFTIVRVLCTFVQFSRGSCGRCERSHFERRGCDYGELENRELGSSLSCLSCLHFYMHCALVPVSASRPWLLRKCSRLQSNGVRGHLVWLRSFRAESEWGIHMAWLPAPPRRWGKDGPAHYSLLRFSKRQRSLRAWPFIPSYLGVYHYQLQEVFN